MSNKTKTETEAEDKLIEQGLTSYRAAMVAMGAFRNSIQSKCEQVLEQNLDQMGQALGTKLTPSQIESDQEPCGRDNLSWKEWDGTCIYLQVQIQLKNLSSDLDHIAVGLEWGQESGVERVWPYTCFVFKTTTKPKLLYEKAAYRDLDDTEPYCLTLYNDAVSPVEGFPFEGLRWTIAEWTKLWNKLKKVT